MPTIALPSGTRLPQPSQPCVAVPVTTRHPTTVDHERPPPATGHQARQAHQEDVPTPATNTQNVFLCRDPWGARYPTRRHAFPAPPGANSRSRVGPAMPRSHPFPGVTARARCLCGAEFEPDPFADTVRVDIP